MKEEMVYIELAVTPLLHPGEGTNTLIIMNEGDVAYLKDGVEKLKELYPDNYNLDDVFAFMDRNHIKYTIVKVADAIEI